MADESIESISNHWKQSIKENFKICKSERIVDRDLLDGERYLTIDKSLTWKSHVDYREIGLRVTRKLKSPFLNAISSSLPFSSTNKDAKTVELTSIYAIQLRSSRTRIAGA